MKGIETDSPLQRLKLTLGCLSFSSSSSSFHPHLNLWIWSNCNDSCNPSNLQFEIGNSNPVINSSCQRWFIITKWVECVYKGYMIYMIKGRKECQRERETGNVILSSSSSLRAALCMHKKEFLVRRTFSSAPLLFLPFDFHKIRACLSLMMEEV